MSDGGDPFATAERETRALAAAPWWGASQPAQRQQVLAAHVLALPDNTWWMFGAGGRWYRLHPSDRRWYLCPPPMATMTRRSARAARPGQTPPPIPPPVFPRGPDLVADRVPPATVVGRPVPENIIFQLRQILTEAGSASASDYPLSWSFFAAGTPSTVAVAWAATLWCASVPVFDTDAPLLELWRPYLRAPLEDHGRMRWLLPPSLGGVCALHAERLRAGRADAAGQLARFMVMTARALREDARFRFRADALLGMVEPILSQPGIDQQAVGYGDTAVEQRWMSRCPSPLSAALTWDTSPGECFQYAWYDTAMALAPLCGDPGSPSFVEPRSAATGLLAADMAGYRPDLAGKVGQWLDPEARELLGAVLGDPGHALRRLWPSRGRLPESLAPAKRGFLLALLGAATAMDMAWCRVAGGIPIPPDGFTVPDACVAGLESASSSHAAGHGRPSPGSRQDPPEAAASGYPPAPMAPPPTLPPHATPPPFPPPHVAPHPAPHATPPPFPPPAGSTPQPFAAASGPGSAPAGEGPPGPSAPGSPLPPAWDAGDAGAVEGSQADSVDPLEDEGEGAWTRRWGG